MNNPPCSHVDILAHRYRLELSSTLCDTEMGRCHTSEQLILVRDDLPPDGKKDVFLHEILHAIHFHMELTDSDSEEAFTSRTATGLRSVMAANPKLCEWLFTAEMTKKNRKPNKP